MKAVVDRIPRLEEEKRQLEARIAKIDKALEWARQAQQMMEES